MPVIKHGDFIDNVFTRVADEAPLPEATPVIVSLKRFASEPERLIGRDVAFGVRLTSEQSPEDLGEHLHRIALIEIEFPKFKDGRGYSWARLLRQRLNFRGEIRAVGDVLRDQWFYMHRCGVDAFEVKPGTRIEDFRAAMTELTVFYQPASDRVQDVLSLRHKRNAIRSSGLGVASAAE